MYVYRAKLALGSKNVPHWHPEERTVVILSGTLYYGLGELWDESKLIAFPAGTFFSEPPKLPHFAWAAASSTWHCRQAIPAPEFDRGMKWSRASLSLGPNPK
jgi:quercetin dioxygenase-like cupin family protein